MEPRNNTNFKRSSFSSRRGRGIRNGHNTRSSKNVSSHRHPSRGVPRRNNRYFHNNDSSYYNINDRNYFSSHYKRHNYQQDQHFNTNSTHEHDLRPNEWEISTTSTAQRDPISNERLSDTMTPENPVSKQNSNEPEARSLAKMAEECKQIVNIKMESKDCSDDSDSSVIEVKEDETIVIEPEEDITIKVELISNDNEEDKKSEETNTNCKENSNTVEQDSVNDQNRIETASVTQVEEDVDADINSHNNIMRGICVYNIPLTLQEQDLLTFYERYGKIVNFKFFNSTTFKNSKYCYLTFLNRLAARFTLITNGMVFDDHVLQVSLRSVQKDNHYSLLMVQHCPLDTTLEDMYNTFEWCGPMVYAVFETSKEEKLGLTAFLRFELRDSIRIAMFIEKFTIRNQPVTLSEVELSSIKIMELKDAMK